MHEHFTLRDRVSNSNYSIVVKLYVQLKDRIVFNIICEEKKLVFKYRYF